MSSENKIPNKLSKETSPYLLQHAYNPVQWYPWGEEALQKAREEDKPILVSIGYSACHWCHVMERESFENNQIAALMNELFVNIKVDREERPDIDHIYMDAIQAMGLQGGWPLNVFLTAEAKPFYGGTYFPPNKWYSLLTQISKGFHEQREAIENSADGFKESLSRSEVDKYNLKEVSTIFTKEQLDKMFDVMYPSFDLKMGGPNRAPKFPMPSIYSFLMRHYNISKNELALQHVVRTLDKMAYGGLYDQIGGGFARYSTDMDWFAPHFEKMLYDNGQLLSLYTEAYQLTKQERYKTIVYETIEWLEREMLSREGGFYSAQDADSEGEEGKFYVWKEQELRDLLGTDIELFNEYYGVTSNGNWEHHQNILIKSLSDEAFANKHKVSLEDLQRRVVSWKEKLYKVRYKRIHPGLDDKILASWNGLALKGIADAYRVFGEQKFLDLAIQNAEFLRSKMKSENQLYHSYKNEKATIQGYLEDYAFVIDAYISLYQATFDEQWINEAIELTNYVAEHFYDENEGLFYFTSDSSEKLIARKKELFDNVIPASNSAMARNLYTLGIILYKDDWKQLAESMVGRMHRILLTDPSYLSNWACLYTDLVTPTAEIAMVGKEVIVYRKELDKKFIPNKVMAGTMKSSTLPMLEQKTASKEATTLYLCYDRSCKAPTDSLEEVIAQLI